LQAVDVVHIAVVANAVVSTTFFVAVYATRPWYRDPVGRSVMMFSFSLMILTWVGLFLRFTEFPWEQWILVFLYGVVGTSAFYQDVVLVRSGRKRKRKRERTSTRKKVSSDEPE